MPSVFYTCICISCVYFQNIVGGISTSGKVPWLNMDGSSPQRTPNRRPKKSTAASSVRPRRALLCLELHHPLRHYAINIVEWKVSFYNARQAVRNTKLLLCFYKNILGRSYKLTGRLHIVGLFTLTLRKILIKLFFLFPWEIAVIILYSIKHSLKCSVKYSVRFCHSFITSFTLNTQGAFLSSYVFLDLFSSLLIF